MVLGIPFDLVDQASSKVRRRRSSLQGAEVSEAGIIGPHSLSTINDCDIPTSESLSMMPGAAGLQDHPLSRLCILKESPKTSNAPSAIPSKNGSELNPSSSFHAFMPSCLSFTSIHKIASKPLLPAPTINRPQNIHTKSEQSFRSICSGISIDSGHRAIIPSVGTTAKFTNKWPAPKTNLRNNLLDAAEDRELSQAVAVAIEAGESMSDTRQRWTTFKWCLLLSVSTVFVYGSVGLACALKTRYRGWDEADVLRVIDNDILIVITSTAIMLLFTSFVGLCGVLLDSRPILALYTTLLWPALISLAAIGYTSYHRVTFALDHKLNLSWSRYITPLGRLLIQDALKCCGYSSPLHGATLSGRCYPRSPLPGCKSGLLRFERENLATIWVAAFSIATLHILNIIVALLCANHLTNTFGTGITPKRYHLSRQDVKADADKIFNGFKIKVDHDFKNDMDWEG